MEQLQYRYVIVGGGIAGGKACEGIRQVDTAGSLALVSQESHRPYQRPPLSKEYLRREAGLDKVYLQPQEYYQKQKVELLPGTIAERLDPASHSLQLGDGRRLKYEKLLLATGGRARRLSIPGGKLTNVFTLRTIGDSDDIHEAASRGSRALVMGGSFIGAEVAASLNQLGVDVTLVFPDEYIFKRVMPAQVAKAIQAMFEQRGVKVLPGVTAKELRGSPNVQSALLDNGELIGADLVVMGVGIDLNTELAEKAGLQLNRSDRAVMVNEKLQSSHADIYAAGDIAAWPDPTFKKRLRVEHWDVARCQGEQAGRNMAGAAESYTVRPNFFSDLFDLSFDVWGDLSQWDANVLRGQPESRSFSVFYFRQGRITAALVCGRSKEEQKLVQQLVGRGLVYEETAGLLADANRDLSSLLAPEKAEEKRS